MKIAFPPPILARHDAQGRSLGSRARSSFQETLLDLDKEVYGARTAPLEQAPKVAQSMSNGIRTEEAVSERPRIVQPEQAPTSGGIRGRVGNDSQAASTPLGPPGSSDAGQERRANASQDTEDRTIDARMPTVAAQRQRRSAVRGVTPDTTIDDVETTAPEEKPFSPPTSTSTQPSVALLVGQAGLTVAVGTQGQLRGQDRTILRYLLEHELGSHGISSTRIVIDGETGPMPTNDQGVTPWR